MPKIAIRIFDNLHLEFVENNGELLMRESNQDSLMGFEDIAIQADGTLIVCDKCGNFGYLDPKRFELRIMADC